MLRASRWLVAILMFGATAALAVPNISSGAGSTEPLYIKHIQKYGGSISNGSTVR